jgi:hypothetical protein
MKVELHINGSHQVVLIPETRIEKAMLEEMAEAAGKGRAVRLDCKPTITGGGIVCCVVSVEA